MAPRSVAAVTIDPSDPRTVRALDVLATASRWLKAHRTADGHPFFVIPSATGTGVYWTDCQQCTCPDYTRRQLACKHVLAVRLWLARHRAAQPRTHGTRSSARPAAPAVPPVHVTPTVDARTAALAARYHEIFGQEL